MAMSYDEMSEALSRIMVPGFVERIRVATGFNTWPGVNRDYCLWVEIGDHPDPYKAGCKRKAITNNPFNFPANEDEFRSQVVTAILMGVAHETIEQVSDGGQHFCSPHRFKGGSADDTKQWLFLLDGINKVVRDYSQLMPTQVPT